MTMVSHSGSYFSESMVNPLTNSDGNVAPGLVNQAILVEMTDKTLHGRHATQRKKIRKIFNGGV